MKIFENFIKILENFVKLFVKITIGVAKNIAM